jgi:hypothetical protein
LVGGSSFGDNPAAPRAGHRAVFLSHASEDTAEVDDRLPERFRNVQWIRAPRGEPPRTDETALKSPIFGEVRLTLAAAGLKLAGMPE